MLCPRWGTVKSIDLRAIQIKCAGNAHLIKPMETSPPTRPAQKMYPGLSLNERKYLQLCVSSGANWFYWIAALSLVNTIIVAVGLRMAFYLGLAFTQIVDAISTEWEGTSRIAFIAIDYTCMGVFAGLGFLAHRKQNWAFVVGMILYGLDGLLLLYAWLQFGGFPFLSLLLHGYAIFRMAKGFGAARELERHYVPPSPPSPDAMFSPEPGT